MNTYDGREDRLWDVLTQTGGLLSAILGFIALLGWTGTIPLISAFKAGWIPMAPSTSLLFILYGTCLFALTRSPYNRTVRHFCIVISFMCALVALLLFFLSYGGIYLEAEHIGIKAHKTINEMPIGHMSPLTASCFVLVGLSFLTSLLSSARRWPVNTAFVFASIVVLTSISLLLAYLFGTPLLYNSGFIPPALSTSLAFLTLGTALMALLGRQIRPKDKPPVFGRMRASYVLILIFISLATGIVTAGYFFYQSQKKQILKEKQNELSAIAELKVNQIKTWREKQTADAEAIFSNAFMIHNVREWMERGNAGELREEILQWMTSLKKLNKYHSILLIDAGGTTRLSFPEESRHPGSRAQKLISEAISTRKIIFSDLHYTENSKHIHIDIVVPLLAQKGNDRSPFGVFMLRVDPYEFLFPVVQSWPTPSRTAETLLIRRDGNDVLYLNELRHIKNTALSLRFPITRKKFPAAMAVLGKEGVVEGIDYRDVPVLAALRAIPDSPWFMVAKMDMEEIFEPYRVGFWLIIILIVTMLITAGIGTGAFWRHQQAQYYRRQYETEIGKRNVEENLQILSFRYEAMLSAVPDIVMEVDNNKVYTWANKAGFKFFGEDVIGKEAAFYFEGEQKTYSIIEPLFKGSEDVIYIESWQRRKDGEKRLLAWWCRVLKDSEGNVTGALSTARDITESKKAEEAVRQSNERIRRFIDSNIVGVVIASPSGGFTEANDYYLNMIGYTREEFEQGLVDWRAITPPEWLPADEQAIKELRERGTCTPYEKEYIRQDGTRVSVFLSDTMLPGPEEQIAAFVLDITERKRAEEELRLTNEELIAINRIITTTTTTTTTITITTTNGGGVKEMLEKVLDEAVSITGLEGGTICLVSDDILHLAVHRATSEATIKDLSEGQVRIGECLCGNCAKDHKPLILPEREDVLRYSSREAVRGEDIRFHAAFPLMTAGKCVGVLCVFTRTDKKPSQRSLKLLETVTSQVALAIENDRLYEETLQYAATLENKVRERTKELEANIDEIERMNKLFVGRELRMIELKEKIKELEKKR